MPDSAVECDVRQQWVMIELLRKVARKAAITPSISHALMRVEAAKYGTRLRFQSGHIDILKSGKAIRISSKDEFFTGDMYRFFDLYFSITETSGNLADYSRPAVHRFRQSKVAFHFPSIPEEEEAIQGYSDFWKPRLGDTVFDVGAHAGASSYFLAQAVGPTGKVFAFEPDPVAYSYLLHNIAMHRLENVFPVRAALSDRCGALAFSAQGTIASGLTQYVERGEAIQVESMTLARACEIAEAAPSFVKMDVEGAEIGIIESSQSFLCDHDIKFSIDTRHLVDGQYTSDRVEKAFAACGYAAKTERVPGITTTWAARASAGGVDEFFSASQKS